MFDPAISDRLLTDNRRIIVIGASGWFGRCTVEDLSSALGSSFSDRVVCVGSTNRLIDLRGGRKLQQIALDDLATIDRQPSLVLHFAFLTKDRAEEMSEEEYRFANARIANAVVGALDQIGAEAVFYASSGAVYKAHDVDASPALRLYGALKAQDEDRFELWARESGRRLVIGRVFNVTGPYINKHQAYALASFILDALAGRTIEVRAPHKVIRGYVAISELMSLAFALILSDMTGTTRFDSGGDALELEAVAQSVAAQFKNVTVHRAAIEKEITDSYLGDDRAYKRLLKLFEINHLELPDQIAKTIDYLGSQQ